MPELREAVICCPRRTPVGRYGGALKSVSAATLAADVIRAILAETHIPPESVDDVLLGQCYPNGEAPAIGRVAALDAGLPITVPGAQMDRRCGSGLQTVLEGCMQIQTGIADLVLAGGVESMSQAEYYATDIRWGTRRASVELVDRLARARVTAGGFRHPVPNGMLETAENVRREYGIKRSEQDALALRSHQRAVTAKGAGRFAAEIVPVSVPSRDGDVVVTDDEHSRRDTTLESLAALPPILGAFDEGATVTAGNASGQNDGAAVCVVTHRQRAEQLDLTPMARLVTWAVSGVPPRLMGIGPVPSTAAALARARLRLADMDLIELNEAFASQVIAVMREWQLTDAQLERVNVNGSGISLGHPVGATGARILATMLHELQRRGGRYALETMCIGGGQGLTAIFERVDA
jgi:acetyl-CoA C-acetyltransferase